ncbi:PREDICTED: glycerophosphodiester phosphodiesterase domain-containing protein 5-like [Cyprinodon variegatus]|uniref:glycerophosphodiester phosphodiesterase domain-containing protein 5-like n=1 Tax=Cyprinodon variegatus TaxID=28743 RepID=UPI0007429C6B|nr:PREDICTED: glycerophosphodiester phosphodiesterase domain-containing protein 5-like [Cyprinodon variegatus]
MVKHQPLQVYEKQVFLSLVTGIYGCRWKRYQRSQDESSKWECAWFIILSSSFLLLLLWAYFWLVSQNDFNDFNWSVYNHSGEWRDETVPILTSTTVGLSYITFLLILALFHISLGQQLNLYWVHKIGVLATLLTTVSGFVSVDDIWGDEWEIIHISLQFTAPFLHIGGLVTVTAVSWLVAGYVVRKERSNFQGMVLAVFIIVLLALCLAPLTFTCPCIMDRHVLKPPPAIIGRRGAPMVTWAPDTDRGRVRALHQTTNEKLSVEEIRHRGITSVTLHYRKISYEDIQEYLAHNVSVTVYPVNEPWLYSILWCSGVPSVSSDAPQVLHKVPYPVWLMSHSAYNFIWISSDIVSVAVIMGIFFFQKWRIGGMQNYNPEQIMLSAVVRRPSRDVNIMKEKLIFSELNNGLGSTEELSLFPENGHVRSSHGRLNC